jgi:hypothetical protein
MQKMIQRHRYNNKNICISLLKGTVSPDIIFYFRVYKFKSVLLVRPLMVFKFVY